MAVAQQRRGKMSGWWAVALIAAIIALAAIVVWITGPGLGVNVVLRVSALTGYTLVFLSILSSAFLRQLVRRFGRPFVTIHHATCPDRTGDPPGALCGGGDPVRYAVCVSPTGDGAEIGVCEWRPYRAATDSYGGAGGRGQDTLQVWLAAGPCAQLSGILVGDSPCELAGPGYTAVAGTCRHYHHGGGGRLGHCEAAPAGTADSQIPGIDTLRQMAGMAVSCGDGIG